MKEYVIEDGILKAYFGNERIVVLPDGIKQIGGMIEDRKDKNREGLRGDLIGYKAFYCNEFVEELYVPDSVEVFGFKCMEHCKNLKVLAFSRNARIFECNSILGCNSLKKILYRGTVFEFCKLNFAGCLDLDEVICTDGKLHFHSDYFIDVLNYPGTIAEFEDFTGADAEWMKRRTKKVVCTDGMIDLVQG